MLAVVLCVSLINAMQDGEGDGEGEGDEGEGDGEGDAEGDEQEYEDDPRRLDALPILVLVSQFDLHPLSAQTAAILGRLCSASS